MPKLELNFLSCGLEPRFKLLITPVTQTYIYLAERVGLEPTRRFYSTCRVSNAVPSPTWVPLQSN